METLGSLQIERIRRNHRGGDLSARELLELLQRRVAMGAERGCRELVRRLARSPYSNMKAHNKGSRDKTMHYTIWIKGKGHHLRLDARGIIFQITDDRGRDLGIIPPWVAPGADPG